jgi:hypothetical protein
LLESGAESAGREPAHRWARLQTSIVNGQAIMSKEVEASPVGAEICASEAFSANLETSPKSGLEVRAPDVAHHSKSGHLSDMSACR